MVEIHLRFIIVIEVHNSNDSLAGLNTVKHQVNGCESPLIEVSLEDSDADDSFIVWQEIVPSAAANRATPVGSEFSVMYQIKSIGKIKSIRR